MIKEISTLSPQIGVGFFLLYENPSTLQKAKEYIKLFSSQDIESIIQSLEKSEQNLMRNILPIKQISKQHKNRSNTIIEINNCLSELKDQLKKRQQIEKQEKKKNDKRIKFIFDSVKIIVVATLSILFVISLFSNNQWTDDDNARIRDYVNEYQQSDKFINDLSAMKQEKHNTINQKQQQKADIQQNQTYNHTLHQEIYSNSSQTFHKQTQNVTFSSFDSIDKPLVYCYNFLLSITSQQVAYFICSYVLFFIFWAIAIILCVLQVVMSVRR